ncbi:MAG: endolytic transglycosylase MltG [Gaiellaceae bacterium]
MKIRLVAALVAAAALTACSGDPGAAPPTTETVPPPEPLRIVFPEGFTREQMAARITAVNKIAEERRGVTPRLEAKRYLALTRRHALPGEFAEDGRPRQLEGFLFPALYEFLPKTTTKQLVEKQLAAFEHAWSQVGLAYAKSKNLTPYDVLIIASMVEKEAAVASERRLIAAVIYNRLKVGMPLGIDATIRYGLKVPGTESLRQSHLDSDNPYNTRRRAGLPPTPIANPGLASIRAAANPARTDHLYFLRKPDSQEHFFTASEDEFFRKRCEYGYLCG